MAFGTGTVRDVRYALRTLARTPVQTVVIVLTLALGIGATTAIFSVVNAVLLQPLPYAEPDRLVRIVENVPAEETFGGDARRRSSMSQDEFDWWRSRSQTLSHMAVTASESRTFDTSEGTVLLGGARVSPALFPMRGVQPLLGRGLLPDDERPDAGVVVIGESTWRRYFAADPNVLGQTIVLDGRAHTIVGVMPPEFGNEAFWTPFFVPPAEPGRTMFVNVTARLADGVSLQAASMEVEVLGRQLRGLPAEPGSRPRFEIVRELDERTAPVVPALRVLVAGVAAVLLIVCTNVANLLLVRGTRRQQEIAIRRSLGATRGRIARQVLTESFVLAAFGGLGGVALAYGCIELLRALAVVPLSDRFAVNPTILPRIEEVAIDPVVLTFVAGLSVVTGAVFGVLPALRLSGFGETRHTGGTRPLTAAGNMRVGHVLATVQLGFAMTLLIGAGLLLHSFLKLAAVDAGFEARGVLSFNLVIPGDYRAQRKLAVAEEVLGRLRTHPQVASAGFTDMAPLQPSISFVLSSFIPTDFTEEQIRAENSLLMGERPQSRYVSSGYLQAIRARLVSGRWFEERERALPGIAALVSRPYARRYFPGTDPVGSTIESRFGTLTIVGVVDDIHLGDLDAGPGRVVFLEAGEILAADPALQSGAPSSMDRLFLTLGTGRTAFAVRTAGDPLAVVPDLLSIVRDVDPALAVDAAMPMESRCSPVSRRGRGSTPCCWVCSRASRRSSR